MPNSADPEQTLSITDFTPGIQHWDRPNIPGVYPLSAPPGSASHAYRCYAKQSIGLLPLPSYSVVCEYTAPTDATNPVCLSLGNMLIMAGRGGGTPDIVAAYLIQHGTGYSCPTDFVVTRFHWPASPTSGYQPTQIYFNTASTWPANTSTWTQMDYGTFQDPSTQAFARVAMMLDPIQSAPSTNPSGTGRWVTVRGWTTPSIYTAPEYASGPYPFTGLIGTYPRVFYHENRMGILEMQASGTATNAFVANDTDTLYVSALLNLTNPPVLAGTFFPEMGTYVSTWGSWSTGEWIGIYEEGGGFIVYGDLYAPSSVYKLPGLMGTGGATGKAALTPIGMIYSRWNDAVYLWNGDNVCQNISAQIPNGVFTRDQQSNGFAASPQVVTSMGNWGDWVTFPNNWLYDTLTQSWWLYEDPNVINFQVYNANGDVLVCSPGIAYADPGEPAILPTYQSNRSSAVSSYFWQSNPIPVTTGDLVTLTSIELIATNLTPTPATIVLQPTSPTSPSSPYPTTPFPNQNDNIITFTIPANVSGYRARRRLGYSDYNVQLAISASNPSHSAPTIHALNIFYTVTRTAGVT